MESLKDVIRSVLEAFAPDNIAQVHCCLVDVNGMLGDDGKKIPTRGPKAKKRREARFFSVFSNSRTPGQGQCG